jgi:hypothetical protein
MASVTLVTFFALVGIEAGVEVMALQTVKKRRHDDRNRRKQCRRK